MVAAPQFRSRGRRPRTGMRTAYRPAPEEYGDPITRDAQARRRYDIIADDFHDLAEKLGIAAN